MPESKPSLLRCMAILPMKGITQRGFLGGRYVKVGGFECIIGVLYEQCAVLGRLFAKVSWNIAKLLQAQPGKEMEFLTLIMKWAGQRMKKYHDIYGFNPDSLFEFVLATEYNKSGLTFPQKDKGTFKDFERMGLVARKKVNLDNVNVWKNVEMTLAEGVGFGLLYPEFTWEIVQKQHQPQDIETDSWKEFSRLSGDVIPKELATQSPKQFEDMIITLVNEYTREFRPELAQQIQNHEWGL